MCPLITNRRRGQPSLYAILHPLPRSSHSIAHSRLPRHTRRQQTCLQPGAFSLTGGLVEVYTHIQTAQLHMCMVSNISALRGVVPCAHSLDRIRCWAANGGHRFCGARLFLLMLLKQSMPVLCMHWGSDEAVLAEMAACLWLVAAMQLSLIHI